MLSARRKSALRRELSAAERIPYSAHVADSVIKTSFGDYLQVFRLSGASFESTIFANPTTSLTINLGAGLAPGATSSTVTVSFANPSNARIGYTTTRFGGSF